jgi:hypothetical protein
MDTVSINPIYHRREWINSVAIFVILTITFSYFLPRWSDMNQNSRIDMVLAIVNDGTLKIDRYVSNTTDYARYNGHYYSDKAPGTAILGVPIYGGVKILLGQSVPQGIVRKLSQNPAFVTTLRDDGSGIYADKVEFAIAQVVLAFFLSVIPSACTGVLIYLFLSVFSKATFPRILVALTYGVLTPVFAYAGQFYGHQLAATFAFGAFFILFGSRHNLSRRKLVFVGTLLGLSVFTEYPLIIAAGILSLYSGFLLWRSHQFQKLIYLFLPSTAIAVGLFAYNDAIFGSPFRLGYSYSELWEQQHQIGFMSLTVPHLDSVWGMTFSLFRGLLILSPSLLLAVPGIFLWFKQKEYRAEGITATVIFLSLFIFTASSAMWWGGFSIGPRYFYPALPFYVIFLIFPITSWGKTTWFRTVFIGMAIISFLSTWGLSLAGQGFPPDTIRNPFLDYAIPNLVSGNIARNIGMLLGLSHWWSLIFLVLLWGGVLELWITGILLLTSRSPTRKHSESVSYVDVLEQRDRNIG